MAKRTIKGFQKAISRLCLQCTLYLSQNDGTLTDIATALQFPIKTFASGPTNSAMGAAYLAGLDIRKDIAVHDVSREQIVVVDIGGTTTDVCALLPSGFPRQAPGFVDIGGVRTAFSMPEVVSIGLGGGSRVKADERTGEVIVGPDSVGHFISSLAKVFGGDIVTATDVIVASGKYNLGDSSLVADIPPAMLEGARLKIRQMVESVIDQMKVSSAPVTALLVGGGSVLVQDQLNGVAACIRPPHHDAANAVGAAIARVAATIDVIEAMEGRSEAKIVRDATDKAIQAALRKGAAKEDVHIAAIDKIPLQYVTNRATRLIIKAVGRLEAVDQFTPDLTPTHSPKMAGAEDDDADPHSEEVPKLQAIINAQDSTIKPSSKIDIPTYRPDVSDGVWYLSDVDLEFISTGTGVLGTGGGGQSYLCYLASLIALRERGPRSMRVISPKALKESDLVISGSYYGAPTVHNERIPAGYEIPTAINAVLRLAGYGDFQALVADEIGGGNGLAAFPVGAAYDRPVVDADCMGRAYPTMEHSTIYINGSPITPVGLADGSGNISAVLEARSNDHVEKTLRSIAIEHGLGVAVAARPLPGTVVKDYAVPNTVSQAWYLGRAIHMARKAKTSHIDAIFNTSPGRLLFSGKIVDVRRDTQAGYTLGCCIIAAFSSHVANKPACQPATDRPHLKIPFQNEYLYAAYTDSDGIEYKEVVCTVPDLISILDADGQAVGSQDLRYGLHVNVIAMPAHPLWTQNEAGMRVGGPQGFGLDMEWRSVCAYEGCRSVIDDFGV